MKIVIQALLPLHSIPVRFYTKAGRDQNTDCNKYLRASVHWLGSRWGGERSLRHHHLLLGLHRGALALAVCGDVRRGAAVAVGGLGPLYV